MTHNIPVRIYFEDTDAGGIVYHASFIRFAERGRTEFLRHLGHLNTDLARDPGIVFVVRHIHIDYLKPAFLDDLLSLETGIKTLKNSSFVMSQKFYRPDPLTVSPVRICDMDVTLVCVDAKTYKPIRLPEFLRHLFVEGL